MGAGVSHIAKNRMTRYICLLAVVIAISLWGVVSAQDAGKTTVSGFTPRFTMVRRKIREPQPM